MQEPKPPALKTIPKLGLSGMRKFRPLSVRLPLHQRVANLLVTGKVPK